MALNTPRSPQGNLTGWYTKFIHPTWWLHHQNSRIKLVYSWWQIHILVEVVHQATHLIWGGLDFWSTRFCLTLRYQGPNAPLRTLATQTELGWPATASIKLKVAHHRRRSNKLGRHLNSALVQHLARIHSKITWILWCVLISNVDSRLYYCSHTVHRKCDVTRILKNKGNSSQKIHNHMIGTHSSAVFG